MHARALKIMIESGYKIRPLMSGQVKLEAYQFFASGHLLRQRKTLTQQECAQWERAYAGPLEKD